MIFFGQRDWKWAGNYLGNTKRTIAQVGCTTCCISDATSYFGITKNPGMLAKMLDYTPEAYIIWSSLGKVGLKLENRFRTYEKEVISEALNNPKKVVALNVDNGGHWVFAIKELGFWKYWVSDPWTGTKKIYGGVVGGAVISKL